MARLPDPLKHAPSRPPEDRHLWQFAVGRDVLIAAAIVLIGWLLYVLRSVWAPLLAAGLLAYLFHPSLCTAETRWRIPRGVLSAALALIMVALIVAGFVWGAPLVLAQSRTLINKTPEYVQELASRYGLPSSIADQLEAVTSYIRDNPMEALSGTGQAVGALGSVIGTTAEILLAVLLVPLYFFLIAWHLPEFIEAGWRYMPLRRHPRLAVVGSRMDRAFTGFFRGRFVIALISAVLYAAVWGLAGVPYWAVLAIVTGILTIIPYASLAGWPFAVAFKYLDAGAAAGYLDALVWPSVGFLAVAFIEGWILTPLIQSQATEMSALSVLIALFIGGAVGGFFGLLLAVPLWACGKILVEEYVLPKLLDEADRA